MNSATVLASARASLAGTLPFPQIVGDLIADGVEYYQVDYALKSFTFYTAAGSVVNVPLDFEGLPPIGESFDAVEFKAAILDSQQSGRKISGILPTSYECWCPRLLHVLAGPACHLFWSQRRSAH